MTTLPTTYASPEHVALEIGLQIATECCAATKMGCLAYCWGHETPATMYPPTWLVEAAVGKQTKRFASI